jgi:TrmH family RNA methyltransferase
VITSLKNRKVARAVRLKKRAMREKDARFLVEGAQAVGEAAAAASLEVLFHTARDRLDPIIGRAVDAGVDIEAVSDEVMERLTSTVTPQGLVGVAPFVDVALSDLPERPGFAALLHAVRDPGNAGTVLRSADAAGAGAVVFCGDSVDVYNPKTVRASAGSVFHVPVVREASVEDAIAAMRRRGMAVVAMSGRGERDLFDLDLSAPTAFLFGNEAWGLPDEVAALADGTVRVPILGRAESLNLAAAATVCLFETARQRSGPSLRPGSGSVAGGAPPLETLIAGAAHDIRSPLTAVKGFASTLSRRWEGMSDEQRQLMLTGIAHDADRLNHTVKLLVDAARLVAGTLAPQPDRVDVGAVVRGLADFLEAGGAPAEVRWTGGEVSALTDPDRLRTAIAAMLEAATWWAQEGPVEVGADHRGSALRLTVRRAGTELSTDEAGALFGPRQPGTGGGSKIGLYVARGIAEAQGGSATAAVEDGALVLRMELPAGS